MKKILIISPGPFSKSDNDGQTLEDIFMSWDKGDIAQFYTNSIEPDFTFCDNYYRVSDSGALTYLLRKKYDPRPKSQNVTGSDNAVTARGNGVRKTPLSMLCRNMLWSLSPWKKKGFYDWVASFNPEILFFEIGDNTYLMKMVVNLKKRLAIPLIVHNTEGFFFIEKNPYMRSNFIESLFYPVIHKKIVNTYGKVMSVTDFVLYSCGQLKTDFDPLFPVPSDVIYKSGSNVKNGSVKKTVEVKRISYVGNLGYYRPFALVEVADVLRDLHSSIRIEVYGKCKTEEEKALLESHPNIVYKGFVDINTVTQIVAESDILLHVESVKTGTDVKYGFTTKIPDSLSSGNCFFMYAPSYVAGASYLKENVPEAVACNKEELRSKLGRLLCDNDLRYSIIERELNLANRNHNAQTISKKINNIINGI